MGSPRRSDRVVVTGIGFITSIGQGRENVWSRLLAGQSGISRVESFDPSRHAAHLGGEIKNFTPPADLTQLDPRQLGRASQLAIAATRLAIHDAGLSALSLPASRVGVAMGTTSGEPGKVEEFDDLYLAGGIDSIGPEIVTQYPSHVIAAHIAAEFGWGGPTVMLPAACAAGNYAIGWSLDALLAHRADIMFAGGADAFSRITYTGFARLGAIAPELCQPFDKGRKGMVPGEGAAVLVLERLDDARLRGARIFAEVAGYGLSCDAHHMTAAHPEGDGAARAMHQALRHAGLDAAAVDYVSAHGTGTPTNDKLETKAMKQVFGDRRVPTSSIKSMLGHTMGAASAIECGVCALAVAENRVPPTINFTEPDPECDVDCVPNQARELPVQVAMNNAYAFGGNNASVIFRKLD